jgi:hypothetical protein
MISKKRLDHVMEVYEQHGFDKTRQKLGVSKKSLRRYIALYKQRGENKFVGPKITLFDIETSPIPVWAWRLGKQYIGPKNVINDRTIICWSAKELMSSKTISSVRTPEEMISGDDSRVVRELWDMMDSSDILIAHNGKNFDIPIANARFVQNGIAGPPSSYQVIDTLLEARKHFQFLSNTQDFLTKMLVLPNKLETNFELWLRCMRGEQEALTEMDTYCQRDVCGMEEVYLKLRPWMKSHPNVALYYDEEDVTRCTKCGNTHLTWGGYYYTPAGRFKEYRCDSCLTLGRSRVSDLTKEERSVLTIPTAR